MVKEPKRLILILLSSLVIAASGVVLTVVVQTRVHASLRIERERIVRMVASEIERSYERFNGWNREDADRRMEQAVREGVRLKIRDLKGNTIMDSVSAGPSASGLQVFDDAAGNEEVYHQPLRGVKEGVGSLEVRFLPPAREPLLNARPGVLVLLWSFLTAGVVLSMGVFILRTSDARGGKPAERSVRRDPSFPAERKKSRMSDVGVPPVNMENRSNDSGQGSSAAISSDILQSSTDADAEPDHADETSEEETEDVQHPIDDTERIRKIIAGLDELGKAESFGSRFNTQPVDVRQRLKGLVDSCAGSVQDREIVFDLKCENDLIVMTDPDCFDWIVKNLLDNAVHALNHKGSVTVSASGKDDGMVLTVSDTGRGIKRKDLPHIFERFYRASGSGIGLGLSIVQVLVAACGGAIDVQTERGKGATFHVRIPREAPS